MVNRTLLRNIAATSRFSGVADDEEPRESIGRGTFAAKRPRGAFVQILGKLYFFDLPEN
jgi:hypothetical protein